MSCRHIHLVMLLLGFAAIALAQDDRTTTIGMPGRIVDLILPGPPLEVTPIERDAPVVVRILQTIGHGPDQHRYEIEYYCLEAGEYNLADYLQRNDGAPAEIPPVMVTVEAQLGAGQVLPAELVPNTTPRVGGYTTWLVGGGIVWLVGLFALLFAGRKRLTEEQKAAQRLSLADRLHPLVEKAMQGELSGQEQANLERMLLTYWRAKLDLNQKDASDAIVELRNHETAGELLRQLESWLHMPADRRTTVDLSELLKPYRNVRADLRESRLEESTT